MERKTRQREAIWAAIKASARPLAPQEIQRDARRELAGLGIATVYRAIRDLCREGLLAEVEVPGHVSRYELAGLPHHHHFYCEDCDKLYELEGCPDGIARLAPRGFKVQNHYLTLVGLCPECAA